MWIDPAEVRRALPAGAVFIDIARFHVFDFQARLGQTTGPARYAAWVSRAEGPVSIVDLGPAEKVEAAVAAVRVAVGGAPQTVRSQGEPAAEKSLVAASNYA